MSMTIGGVVVGVVPHWTGGEHASDAVSKNYKN